MRRRRRRHAEGEHRQAGIAELKTITKSLGSDPGLFCFQQGLRVRDLSGSDRFKLTQEYMATMIGSRRNAVSLVAHTLQQSNVIKYSRDHIEIADPEALQKSACECYGELRAQYQRLRFSV